MVPIPQIVPQTWQRALNFWRLVGAQLLTKTLHVCFSFFFTHLYLGDVKAHLLL